ncbi:leucyl aminopeptidase [Prochlorococcus marinus]|uniref:Probable cytosol aminopeptidase n=1 Tax=Prochlorococcus marinus (strain MIT 9211) TaxID=93059 RepID=AMPA_PROM4|nr:leucyl aminopeptidase [Prochlorococcus marinus]A9BBV5.1 RecName: Full=Probable cytosol aminopeptidase; AltName: Full=Leucine aminopeptidase; Short=LAP; AltName: Full=Leucyl aminopeptidase [Prochlorococcus marinus str. MIT 9211]ABX09317.1 Cytosol aminopeptidase [Prochlorococcus marinus str. MIT 9211]
MQISIIQKGLEGWRGSILVFGLLEGALESQLNALKEICTPASLAKALQDKEFVGKQGDLQSFQLIGKEPREIVLIGLGSAEKLVLDDLRKATAISCRKVIGQEGTLGILLPWDIFDSDIAAKAVGEAVILSFFKDNRFQKDPKQKKLPNKLELLGLPESSQKYLSEIVPICSGVKLARELVGAPPNSLTPSALANQAKEIANQFGLEAKILGQEECQAKNMGAFLAVSQGSDLSPKFIHLTYRAKGEIKRRIAMVGKGLTFDSGGYNLKVGASQIEMMKYDMGGSAAVIGAARAIGELAPSGVEIHFLVATCENMINGSAVHPGDIVKASNGTTIEINNTDAEGRLTLADALTYACELKPDAIVDLATLTGACVIALGEELAGLWTNSKHLSKELKESAEACGEGLWEMPLQDSYKEGLKSMLADIKNTGPRAGGSITAALFLKEFIKEDIAWAHIDIAGTCWTDKDRGINPAGATGFGVRTLVNWASRSINP